MQRPLFKKISAPIDTVLNGLDSLFNLIPFPLAILIFLYFAYKTNGFKFAILTMVGLVFIDLVDLWSESMTTLAMIFTAVIFCIIIGIPLGILSSRSKTFEVILRPILDIMQTIPSFVYLIPVVMLFGIGLTPGVVATIIFALPPIIRLTNLGIRQVGKGFKEAGSSLGLSRLLILINPKPIFPNDKIFATSVGAKDIIKQNIKYDNLEKALGKIDIVIATSARFRNKNIKHIKLEDLKKINFFMQE